MNAQSRAVHIVLALKALAESSAEVLAVGSHAVLAVGAVEKLLGQNSECGPELWFGIPYSDKLLPVLVRSQAVRLLS